MHENAFELVHRQLDVARERDVDEDERPGAASGSRLRHHAAGDDRPRSRRGGEDDVGVGERIAHGRDRDGAATELPGEPRAAFGCAVGDHDRGDAGLGEVPAGKGGGRPGADQEQVALAEIGEDLLGEAESGVAHRDRPLADSGFSARPLPGPHRGR